MEQHDVHVQEPVTESNLIPAGKSLSNLKPKLPTIPESEENSAGGMDCHICLDVVQDPVVTFCGHLYCWPCIYKWMHLQTVPSGMADHQQQHPQCPVCKAVLSKETLIPLYGRGLTSPKSPANDNNGKGRPQGGIVIPQRPPSPRCDGGFSHQTITSPTTATINSRAVPQLHPRTNENRRHRYPISGNDMDSSSSPTNNNNNNNYYYNVVQHHHPIVGVLCDMAFAIAKMFGIPETSLHSDIMDRRSPRMRRQLMKIDRSLSRVSFFLLCCVIFCLLVF